MVNTGSDHTAESHAEGRKAGIILVVATAYALVMIFMHPTAEAGAIQNVLAEIAAESWMSGFVHGTLIIAIGAFIYGHWVFTEHLGFTAAGARLGLISYVMGYGSMVLAALVSGFVTTGLALRYAGAVEGSAQEAALKVATSLSFGFNQAYANFGVYGIALALVLISIVMIGRAGPIRLVGAAGLVIGLATGAAFAAGLTETDLHGMIGLLAGQAIWNFAIAWLLITRRV